MSNMTSTPIKTEVCVQSLSGAIAAERGGADRIELCANLSVGGTTPTGGLISHVIQGVNIPVMVMIRPRAGDFTYASDEREVMLRDIVTAKDLGAAGIVFGGLTAEGCVDVPFCREVTQVSAGMEVTFHRAFDWAEDAARALDSLKALKVDRILTSGQQARAENAIPRLRELVTQAGPQLSIMPGSGVMEENVQRILQETGAREIHFSASRLERSNVFQRVDVPMSSSPNVEKLWVTDEDRVRKICELAKR